MASKYKYEYFLEQQTPLIHFQHDQSGATLRASEVKPKLDRFIIDQCGGEDAMREHPVRKRWFLGKHPALNYKMSIRAIGTPIKSTEIEAAITCLRRYNKTSHRDVVIQIPITKSYFGNMVQLDNMNLERKIEAVRRGYKESVFYPEGHILTIVCFDPELQKETQRHIDSFFLKHNFGTRSNKGFGSYMVKKHNGVQVNYDPEAILKATCGFPLYRVDADGNPTNATLMKYANELYRLMKSGINQKGDYFRSYLFQYMHHTRRLGNRSGGGVDIGNEKAWLKRNRVVPIVGRDVNIGRHEHDKQATVHDFRYVRAVLGVGDSLSFVNEVNTTTGKPISAKGKTKVDINRIEGGKRKEKFRFPSPVVFKIINEKLYILPYSVNSIVLGKKFGFSSEEVCTWLETPQTFDMDQFISCFADYINADCAPPRYDSNKKLSQAETIRFRGKIARIP